MDYRSCVESFVFPACVFSVEKTRGENVGDIRVVCANQIYQETMGERYKEGAPYHSFAPKNAKFEDLCYRAAIKHERVHSYVQTGFVGWSDQMIIPLVSENESLGYCLFLFELQKGPVIDHTSHISLDTAALALKTCMGLISTENFQKNVIGVLDDIIAASEAENGRIMLMNSYKREAVIFAEKAREGTWERNKEEPDVISYELMQNWEKLVGDASSYTIETKEDMKKAAEVLPAWVADLQKYYVKNLLLVPLRRAGKIVGYLYIVNYNTSKTEDIREMIEVVALFLGSEIANHLLFLKLEEISNIDELTGLKNRHAMMSEVDEMGEGGRGISFGILTLDLNGLKKVNDTKGHIAGDNFLIRTTMILQDAYGTDNLYRIGGDEFIVLFPEDTEEEFAEHIQQFCENILTNPKTSLSYGTCWYNGTGITEDSFYKADLDMYENKRRFYEQHPELR